MEPSRYRRLLTELAELDSLQAARCLRHLARRLALASRRPRNRAPTALAAALDANPLCPWCGAADPWAWGHRRGLSRWRCRGCRKTFTATTCTPLTGLRKPDRWLAYGQCMKEGQSLRSSAGACDLDLSTAFRWRHRFLAGVAQDQAGRLEGIVEGDETYFRHSRKGERMLDRPARVRGTPASPGRVAEEWVPVVTLRDRGGAVRDRILRPFNAEGLRPELEGHLAPGAVLCTDGHAVYVRTARLLGLTHEAVNLKGGIRARGRWHVQNLNAYHSRLRQWMARFHGVATKYLAHYLGWRRLLDGREVDLKPVEFLRVVAGQLKFQPTSPT